MQDPQVVGTALRTVAMRIRGAKSELEDLGEDTEGMAESVSKLRDELLALSGVDIMIDDSTFKDTYQIMLDLARVWDSLTDVTQANILEKIAGKRGANAVASILSNVKDLEAAYAASQNSAGSALAENRKYLESIEGRISQLSATWQEFWDNAINSDVVKIIISALDGLLQFINSIGGLNTAIITLGLSTFILDLGKIRSKFVDLIKVVGNVGDKFGHLRAEMQATGTKGWQLPFQRNLGANSSKAAISSVASAYNAAMAGLEGDVSSAMLAKQDAMGVLLKQYPDLTDEAKALTEAMLDEAAATGGIISNTQQAATAQKAYNAQVKAGAVETAAMTAAQTALRAAMSIGIGIAIGAGLEWITTQIQKQEQLRQALIENAKSQTEQAKSVRAAIKDFDEINLQYRDGKASQEELEPAIRAVNEALGDQSELLAGLVEGSDDWIAKARELSGELNDIAKAGTTAALSQSANTGAWYDLFGWFGTSIKDRVSEYHAAMKILNHYNDQIVELEKKRKSATSTGEIERIDSAIAGLRRNIELLNLEGKIADEQDAVKTYLDSVVNYYREAYTPKNFGEFRDSLESLYSYLHTNHGILLKDMELVYDAISIDPEYAGWANAIKSVNEFVDSLEYVRISADEILNKYGDDLEKVGLITSKSFKDFIKNNQQVVTSIEQLDRLLSVHQSHIKATALTQSTLFKAVGQNKDAIDKFQDAASKLGSIMNADYDGNASGLIDDLQSLVEIIGEIGGDEADRFIDKLNESGYSIEAIQSAMKEVSGDLFSEQLEKIIDDLSIAKPELAGLAQVFKNIVSEAQQLEAVTQSLDGLKGAYQSVTDVIKQYNDAGMLNADSMTKLLSMSTEYLGLLKFENGQLQLNKETLRTMFLARLDELEAQVESTHQSQIAAIYKQAEAKSADLAAEATADLTRGIVLQAIAAAGATKELGDLKDAVDDYRSSLGSRDSRYESLSDEFKAMIDGADAAYIAQKENILNLRAIGKSESVKMIDDFFGMTDTITKDAEDAASKLKSAIDSVLSRYKSALDSGAISWKDYLSKMKNILDQYGDQLSLEDKLGLERDYAQAQLDMWSAGKDAFERYVDRTLIMPVEKSKEALEEQKKALEENRDAIEKYYDSITKGLEKQKEAIEDEIEAIEKSYEAQIKPLEKQQKAIEKQTKAIEKQKRAIEDEIAALEKTKKPYEDQQKAIEKQIKTIQRQIDALEATKKPYEDQQKAIEAQIKSIERQKRAIEDQIDALEKTKKPYEKEQKAIQNQIKAIQKQVDALEATKKPYEDQQKAIEKQIKAIEKQKRAIEDQIDALEKTKRPYEEQQRQISKQTKELQKQLDALEDSKRPYEDQQAAIDKQVRSLEKEIKAIQDTEKPYKDQQKALQNEQKEIQKSIRAIEEKITAMEALKEPYQKQLDVINKEIASLEREAALLERTKKPYQERQQVIQNEINAIEYEIAVKQRAEKSYKREQDAIGREVELLERQVAMLERRKKPYEIAQREISRQIKLLQDEQEALEDLKKPYQDEIEALEKEKQALQEANDERAAALELQQAQYNLQRAQNQRTNLVYQGGQFQYVANEQEVKEAQQTLDNLKYEESVRAIEKAIDNLQDKIDEITAQSDLIQDAIDDLTSKNDDLADSIDSIQYEIDLVQDSIDEFSYKSEVLGWAISDVEYSLLDLQYQVEDLQDANDDLGESIRRIDEQIQPLNTSIEKLKWSAEDLQREIDLIQESITPLSTEIDGLNRKNDELQNSIDGLQEKIDEIEETIVPLQEKIDELNEQSDQIQESIDAITESMRPLEDEIDNLNRKNDELQESIDAIDDQIAVLQQDIEPLQDQIDELERQNESLQESIDAITESMQGFESEIDALNQKNDELQGSIDAIDEAIEGLQEQLEPFEAQIEELERESDLLQDAIDKITESIVPLEAEIDNLNLKNEELQGHIDQIDDAIGLLQEKIVPLDEQLESLARQNEELGEQIGLLKEKQEEETEVLKNQVEAISAEIEAYNDLRDAAIESIDKQVEKIDESIIALDKEIERINAYKKSIQDIFDEIEARADEDLLTQLFGEGWQEKIQSLDPQIVKNFADGYHNAMEQLKQANTNIANSLGDVETQLHETEQASDDLKKSLSDAKEATGQGSVMYALDSTSVQALQAAGVFGDTTITVEDLKYSLNTYESEATTERDGLIDLLIGSKMASEEARQEFDKTATAAEKLKQIVHAEVYEMLSEIELLFGRIQTVMPLIIKELDDAYERIAGRVDEISRKAKDMGQDVDAVLANIEGRFAIVEQQIGNTADAVSKASQPIKDALRGIKDEADAVVQSIQAIGGEYNKIGDGARQVDGLNKALDEYERRKNEIDNSPTTTNYHTVGGSPSGWHSSGGGTVNSAYNPPVNNNTNNYHTAGGNTNTSGTRQSGGGGPTTPYRGVKNIKETTLRTKAGQEQVEKWRSLGYDVQIVTWSGKIQNTLQRFGRGGVVSIGRNGIAIPQGNGLRRVGEDTLVAAKDGERILTKAQNEGFEELIKLTPELISATKELSRFAKMFSELSLENSFTVEENMTRGLERMRRGIDYQAPVNNTMSITIGDINITDASNADDLALQIKNNLPNSLLQAMGRG